MNDRDAQAWELQRHGFSVRAIAHELGMPASSVQRCLQRAQKREQQFSDAMAEPGDVVAVTDDELTAEDVRTPFDVAKLSRLELWRLGHRPDLPADVRMAMAAAWAALPRPEITYPINDDGPSWREGVDRAMSDDSGTDDDDW
jgi:transposase